MGEFERRWQFDGLALAQPLEGEAVAAVNAGLLEDVFHVDLDGTRADAEFGGDFAVFEAALDESEDFAFAGGEVAAAGAGGWEAVAEEAIFDPGFAAGDGAEATEDLDGLAGFAEDAAGAALEEAESVGFGEAGAPDDDAGIRGEGSQFGDGAGEGLSAEGSVEEQDMSGSLLVHVESDGEAGERPVADEVIAPGEEDAKAVGRNRLGLADGDKVFERR